MAGTAAAAEGLGQVGHLHLGVDAHALGVDIRHLRYIQQLDALAEQFFLVGGEGAGVAVEILAGAELQRVHKDTDDDDVREAVRSAYQFQVPFVEIAHGGNESDALALLATVAQGCLQWRCAGISPHIYMTPVFMDKG